MKKHFALGMLSTVMLLLGCNAGTESTRPATSEPSIKAPQTMPVSNITPEDLKYANLLQQLSQRNPQTEAEQAIASGTRTLLGYYAGRAGLKIPGLSSEQQASQRCTLTTVDGLGDVIYGENHLKYRIAMRNFAKTFNVKMLDVCL